MNLRLTSVVISSVVLFTKNVGAQDICSEIDKIASLANSGFREIRGSYDSYMEEYAAEYWLPNASECSVTKDSLLGDSYSCSWDFGYDKSSAIRSWESMVNSINSCESFRNPKSRESESSRSIQTSVRWTGRNADARVKLYESKSRRSAGRVKVMLDITEKD